MKTVLQITTILFFAVIFGAAQDEGDSEFERALEACHEMSYFNDSVCLDYAKIMPCLKGLKVSNDEERRELTGTEEYLMERQTACPAFKERTRCIDSETDACMENFNTFLYSKDKKVCNTIESAKQCLVKFNNTCNIDVIDFEMGELEEVQDECNNGHWEDGPCSPDKIYDCTYTLLGHFREGGDEFVDYACEPDEIAAAEKCLTGLADMCSAEDQLEEIQDERDYIRDVCSDA